MQRGFHQPSKCISVAHDAPTSTWSGVFHLNKHFLLKWCVWLIANSHGHLQQSRNPHTNNLKIVLCHTCIGWVPSGINWAKLLLLCGSQVLKSKTHGGCRIIDFMYTLHYIGPNQCIGEKESPREVAWLNITQRGGSLALQHVTPMYTQNLVENET